MAPSARAVQKAEAKYGVTADYPDLQLHSAAANGNVGLVKYALMHGQPVNSVLNGVLPIHIAASSGNEMIVQMLIEAGADVNAARLPKKYNTDRAKAGTSIGTAGSTPLHFAAANGHANVVSLLLSHNANPNVPEKHGMTAEDLARDSGHVNVLTVLRLWRQSEQEDAHAAAAATYTPERDQADNVSLAPSTKSLSRASPARLFSGSARKTGQNASVTDLRATAAANSVGQAPSPASSVYAGSTGSGGGGQTAKKILHLDHISSKGKKLAKAASNPNLAALLSGHGSSNGNGAASSSSSAHHSFTISAPSSHFPAPAPLTLRQTPSTSASNNMHRQATQPNHLMHHIINTDKARRPSLPSVLEKAAHPSASIKSALGMTPTSTTFGKNRSSSTSSSINSSHHPNHPYAQQQSERHPNDPYHFNRPKRSASRTSLSSVFRSHGHGKDRSGSENNLSQPLSPAASSFFTGDDELEQADREAFLRNTDTQPSSGDEAYQQQYLGYNRPYHPPHGYPDARQQGLPRRNSSEFLYGRSRAGSGSSAATTGSGSVGRGYPSTGATLHPVTAPPTQSTFFPPNHQSSVEQQRSAHNSSSTSHLAYPSSRPSLSQLSSSSNVIIPQPIAPPPSSSTQPFFTKAAITAAHNNLPISRPGFYRPRKSSQLSNPASTLSGSGGGRHVPPVYSPDSNPDFGSYSSATPRQFSPFPYEETLDDDAESSRHVILHGRDGSSESGDQPYLQAPSVIVRRPTVREASTQNDSAQSQSHAQRIRTPTSPAPTSASEAYALSPLHSAASSRPGTGTGVGSPPASSPLRHSRASSDGTGTLRTTGVLSPLPDVLENSTDLRQRSLSHGPLAGAVSSEDAQQQELDPETARESEDTFPVDQERPFPTRSRAGSRARVDSVGSSGSSIAYSTTSPNLQPSSAFNASHYYHTYNTGHETDSSWSGMTRPSRSGSTGTDTRTSRSGSTGEGPGHPPRFFGFEYSSSPASTSSMNYQASNTTSATNYSYSSPPGTAPAMSVSSTAPSSDGKGTTFNHAQAKSIVKRKEEELLSYGSLTPASSDSDGQRRLSLSQQLAAYGESLSIERELHKAEARRQNPHEPITLTIPEPPPSAKYSWEILGKETRTTVPTTSGQRVKGNASEVSPAQKPAHTPNQPLWTHKMVSPFEVPLPRPSGTTSGHKHTPSSGTTATITSSGKTLTRVTSRDPPMAKDPSSSTVLMRETTTSPNSSAVSAPRDPSLRNKTSTLSASTSYLAPPTGERGGSDLSIRRPPRISSASPGGRSPRSSSEKERLPSNTYHVVAGPGSEPTDSANSSLVSEPRSAHRGYGNSYATATPMHASLSGHRHKHTRSDPPNKSASQSPEQSFGITPSSSSFMNMSINEETPKPQPQYLKLETTLAPKFHIETRAGGDFAPSPTKSKFSTKIGKLFK